MQPSLNVPDSLDVLPSDFIVPLPDMASLVITGEDARSFLHGQLTIDVNKLTEHNVRRAAHCDFKGKSWSISLVGALTDGLLVIAPEVSLTATQEQLKKYGVFSKITITDNSSELSYFFIKGAKCEPLLHTFFPDLPDSPGSLTESDAGFCLLAEDYEHGYLVGVHSNQVPAFTQAINDSDISWCHESVYTALNIQWGIPSLNTSEHINQFVPQMMNLQALNAIDFNKGCYMGQEVVARTRYLGKNKRAAMTFKLEKAVEVNDSLVLEKQIGENWRSAGTILQIARLGQETWFQAIVSNDSSKEDILRLSTDPTVRLIHCDLPYTLD